MVATAIVVKRVKDDAVVKKLEPILKALAQVTESEIADMNAAAGAIKAGKPIE